MVAALLEAGDRGGGGPQLGGAQRVLEVLHREDHVVGGEGPAVVVGDAGAQLQGDGAAVLGVVPGGGELRLRLQPVVVADEGVVDEPLLERLAALGEEQAGREVRVDGDGEGASAPGLRGRLGAGRRGIGLGDRRAAARQAEPEQQGAAARGAQGGAPGEGGGRGGVQLGHRCLPVKGVEGRGVRGFPSAAEGRNHEEVERGARIRVRGRGSTRNRVRERCGGSRRRGPGSRSRWRLRSPRVTEPWWRVRPTGGTSRRSPAVGDGGAAGGPGPAGPVRERCGRCDDRRRGQARTAQTALACRQRSTCLREMRRMSGFTGAI